MQGDTLAFLFTDIEASTQRWERDREAMAAALALHDRLLTAACVAAGGEVFSHTGDGLCAAFPSAREAVDAAVRGQLALAGEGSAAGLRVRMAVHVGSAERRDGNYFGPTLNRTARLMAAAWGGQVLCSGAAAGLADGQLPEDVELVDLGEVTLPDLALPERVFQVDHPDLPASFPPLRARQEQRSNLPYALTPFVGRQRDVENVVGQLLGSRLVTLCGPGGAGKTRLALEAARSTEGRFPDGVWLVDLTTLRDPDLVAYEMAAVSRLDPSALSTGQGASDGLSAQRALCEHLRSRRLLFVVDNCEHVIAAVAELVQAVLARCPGVVVLATSRELLGLPGEVVVRVEGLAADDAVALFCARAQETVPGFAVTDADAELVARICRRLDGLPLALELAAARLRLLGAAQLADGLDRRLGLLAGPRAGDPRHQTLRATIDWSHNLLPEAERMALRRTGIFPAPWTLDAAVAVIAKGEDAEGPQPDEAVDLVARLVDKSLVLRAPDAPAGQTRYRLLEAVREYATERLVAAGEVELCHARLRGFLLAMTQDWVVERFQGSWLRRVVPEVSAFRAALTWSAERRDEWAVLALAPPLWLYWMNTGAVDSVPWLERAVAAPVGDDLDAAVQARIGLALIMRNLRGDAARSESLLREALALAEARGDKLRQADALGQLGDQAAMQGRFEEAWALADAAAEFYADQLGRPRALAWINLLKGWVSLATDDVPTARHIVGEGLDLLADAPGHYLTAHLMALSALIEAVAGDATASRAALASATEMANVQATRQVRAMVLARSAEAEILLGDRDRARTAALDLLTVLHELGGQGWVAEALEVAAILLVGERPPAAASYLRIARSLRRASNTEAGRLPQFAALIEEAERSPDVNPDDQAGGGFPRLPDILLSARDEIAGMRASSSEGDGRDPSGR